MGDQRQDCHLVLHRVCGERDRLSQNRCVRGGVHHAMSSWSFSGGNTTGETGCGGKSLDRKRGVGCRLTVEGV